MSNARPALARKVTPKSEKSRKEALDVGVSIKVDGVEYTVRAGDLTGLDAMALRKECGYSFLGLIRALQEDQDIDLIAALMWLSRRTAGEVTLRYTDVAAEIGYDADIDLAETSGEDESPEG